MGRHDSEGNWETAVKKVRSSLKEKLDDTTTTFATPTTKTTAPAEPFTPTKTTAPAEHTTPAEHVTPAEHNANADPAEHAHVVEDEDIVRVIIQQLQQLRSSSKEAVLMQLSRRVKVTICGNQYNMKQLIQSAIAAKAAPVVHAVIADEVIRLGIGRREYRTVVVPLYKRIRDAIGWVDSTAVRFCPKWRQMKKIVQIELRKGPNKAIHTKKADWCSGTAGCVWTQVELYLAERLVAYRDVLPQTYKEHLKTITRRVNTVRELLPG